ncbi:MAG TPA: hypothetical protein VHM20_08095, partial [Gammaproteobacteria bacterium]|nr:hypothetical protein [Gammaproteobacteria bacterium]
MSFPRNNSQPLTEADVFTEQRKKQYKNALQKIIEKNSDEEIWVKQFEEFEKSKFNKETHEKNMNYLQHAYQASSPDL